MNIKNLARGVTACFIFLAGCSSPMNIYAQGTASKYTDADLVWQDSFDGKKLNTKDWNYETHEPGWVNNELQSYEASTKNVFIKDGNLVIQPVKSGSGKSASYTSGRINTQGKHTATYGRIEARIKVPSGQGFLPAFWMMPEDESFYGQWPKCGEIDIMEVLGNQTDTVFGTLHYGEPHAQAQGAYTLNGESFADDFHVYAVEWEPGEIRFYCDDINYNTVNNWFTKRQGFEEITFPAPFDQPFYIIFNVAVGGDWPGNPDETTTFDEKAQMLVDYVKVFQKSSYNEIVDKPVMRKVETKVDSTGNILKTGAWTLLKFQGGDGSINIDKDKFDVYPAKDGPVEYAVQIIQPHIPVEKGFIYRYSFDAYADENRTVISGISAPYNGWFRYFPDTKVKLTPEKQHFSWDFNMVENTDYEARIEFNCGLQKSLAPVHISNVRLEKIGELDLSTTLKLLPDGNMVYNGQFQVGKNRMDHWEIDNATGADISVTNIKGKRELKVVNPDTRMTFSDVKIIQNDIKLPGGKEYLISFDAYATKKCMLGVKLDRFKQYPEVDVKPAHYEFTYKPIKTTVCPIEFYLGVADTTIYLDNVSLKENTSILNGNFESDMAAWELYAHQSSTAKCSIEETDGNKFAAVEIEETGNMDWMIQLKQNGICLEKGKKYHVSFKAKSDLNRTIMWALQRDGSKDDNWIPYSDTKKINVTNDFQTFEHTFTMGSSTDENTIFTISMGAVDNKQINTLHKVIIDDVVIETVNSK